MAFLDTQNTDKDMYDWFREMEKKVLSDMGATEALKELDKEEKKMHEAERNSR